MSVKWPRMISADVADNPKKGESELNPRRELSPQTSPLQLAQRHSTSLQYHIGNPYLYRLSASFSKSSASMNRGTALHSKGMGRLCLLVSPNPKQSSQKHVRSNARQVIITQVQLTPCAFEPLKSHCPEQCRKVNGKRPFRDVPPRAHTPPIPKRHVPLLSTLHHRLDRSEERV